MGENEDWDPGPVQVRGEATSYVLLSCSRRRSGLLVLQCNNPG